MCHNLNNILTGVLLPAETLQATIDDPAMREAVDTIVLSARRATELVHHLHQSVRSTGETALRPVRVSPAVHQVLRATRPRWKDEPEARGLRIEVRTELGRVAPIRGTESGFHALLTNLVFNAVDAMPQGGTITIRTAMEGERVRVDFSDTGVGMDAETRLRLFEPFFTTKPNVGTGLGLSTLHNTLTHWGGTVKVDSAPGQGATFTLRLPVCAETPAAANRASKKPAGRSGRILIVDDDQTVCRVLSASLGSRNQVDAYADPSEALRRFTEGQYDVAIIDLGMAKVSGEEVARQVRQVDPAVATVLFTGWELAEDDPRRRPFDLWLGKPLENLEALWALVDRAVEFRNERARPRSVSAAPKPEALSWLLTERCPGPGVKG